MPNVTTYERRGMLRSIEIAIGTRFGEEGLALMSDIAELNDAEKYDELMRIIIQVETLGDVRWAVDKAAEPPRRPRMRRNGRRVSAENVSSTNEEGRPRTYVTSELRHEMLLLAEVALGRSFGEAGIALLPAIAEVDDAEAYDDLLWAIVMSDSVEEVQRAIAGALTPTGGLLRVENGKRGRMTT
jgi:hypothetical protein